jgi:hypothetical protein
LPGDKTDRASQSRLQAGSYSGVKDILSSGGGVAQSHARVPVINEILMGLAWVLITYISVVALTMLDVCI